MNPEERPNLQDSKDAEKLYNKLVKEWTEQIITEYSTKNGSSQLFMPEKGRQQQLFQKASNNLCGIDQP